MLTGNSESTSLDLSGDIFAIQDDGPSLNEPTQLAAGDFTLDETRPEDTDEGDDNTTTTPDPEAPAGDASVTLNVVSNFNQAASEFGTDGAGSRTLALALSANGIGSGLYALDPNDTVDTDTDGIGQGDEILLSVNADGTVVTGSANGVDYFTITVDGDETSANFGDVTFTQLNNIWHGNVDNDDDEETLSVDGTGETFELVQTVTDADGDSESTSLDLSGDIFAIQDDGPSLNEPTQLAAGDFTLDETRPEDTDEGDDNTTTTPDPEAPAGDASVTLNVVSNFNQAASEFGTDGAGSRTLALALSANGIGSGLYALDPNDTVDTDTDGIGQGDEILLSVNADGTVVTGSANGVDYFTITVDGDETSANFGDVTFTQLNNIWHGNVDNDDDEETLSVDGTGETFELVQTVTDADGELGIHLA